MGQDQCPVVGISGSSNTITTVFFYVLGYVLEVVLFVVCSFYVLGYYVLCRPYDVKETRKKYYVKQRSV